MKKIFIFLAAVFLSSISLFAETSAKYKELLAKAKKYEQDKKYYFALGTYYDAVAAEQTVEAKEAYDSFIALEKMIRDGNPGYETKDEFEMHDSWKAFMKEFESYWSNSENIPIQFYISDIKKVSVNFDTRTTNYKVYFGWDYTLKYKKLRYIFTSGYLKSYRSDWTDFPSVADDIFINIGTFNWYRWPEGQASINESNFPASGERDGALYEFIYWNYDANGEKYYPRGGISTQKVRIAALQGQNYELTVSFVDKNGTAVLSEKRSPGERSIYVIAGDGFVKAEENYSVTFKNVPQSITAKINSGDIKVKVTSASLEYGIYHDDIDRRYKKTLDISKITFVPFDSDEKIEDKGPIKNYDVIKSYEEIVAKKKAEENHKTFVSNLVNVKMEVNSDFGNLYLIELSPVVYKVVAENQPENPDLANGNYYDAIYICNLFSIKMGLSPVYSVNRNIDVARWSTKTSKDSKGIVHYTSLGGKISQNATVTGFRLPAYEDKGEFEILNKLNLSNIWTYSPFFPDSYYINNMKGIVLILNK